MSLKIAIASGKGGTGKTTVSVNLLHFIKQNWTPSVQLADCDVEEPNAAIFFKELKPQEPTVVNQLIPFIDTDKCTFCRKCVEYCAFNAIVVIPPAGFAEVNPTLCHSCGACSVACESDAITEKPYKIGDLIPFSEGNNTKLLEGNLKIGSPMQTMVIKSLIKDEHLNADILLFDAPPGTSCPVVATVTKADYIILVTEPSPFGLHDLKLMIALLKEIDKPFGVVINKDDNDFPDTISYLEKENIELLGRIPFDMDYARRYAQGNLFMDIPEEITATYQQLTDNLKNKLQ